MGLKETLGKMIGIEEQDETITEEEIEREKENLKREESRSSATSRRCRHSLRRMLRLTVPQLSSL